MGQGWVTINFIANEQYWSIQQTVDQMSTAQPPEVYSIVWANV